MSFRRLALCAALATAAGIAAPAEARCTTSDRWSGPDKLDHLAAGATIAIAVTLQTGSRWTGFAAGAAVGAAKELLDAGAGGTCSLQDFAVTAAAAAVGAQLGGWMFTYRAGRVGVAWSTGF